MTKRKRKLLKKKQKNKWIFSRKTDEEIIEIANPIWDNLVKSSIHIKDYGGFTRDFSSQMLFGANEVELGKQWANNKLLTSLSDKKEVLGCLRRNLACNSSL